MNFSFATLRKRYVLLTYGKALAHTHRERSGQITGQVAHQAVCTVQGHSGDTSRRGGEGQRRRNFINC